MDRDGLQSTISLGHGQGRGRCGSLVLGEPGKPCGWKIAGHRGAEDREGGETCIRPVMVDVQGRQGDNGGGHAPFPRSPLAITRGRFQGMGFGAWICTIGLALWSVPRFVIVWGEMLKNARRLAIG